MRPERPPTPDALLTLAARGDEAAFAEFYDRCAPSVFGLARRIVGDGQASTEVAREVFVQAWCRSGAFDPTAGSAMCWLLDLAHRHAVESARARGDSTGGAYPRTADDRPMLDDLPAECRSSVAGTYYGAQTYREVAESRHVSPDVVKADIRDGMARLHEAFESGS